MPWTAALFLIGVLAIAALPPLNGFVSEWLTLYTMLRAALLSSSEVKIVFALSGAVLAATAGLALTCFAKIFAMSFLGVARSPAAARVREGPSRARGPMAAFALLCLLLGVLPTYLVPMIDRTVAPIVHASATEALVPPFFAPELAEREGLSPEFRGEFHDLGAEVGRDLLPGRGLVVLHRGGASNPVVFAMSTAYMLVALAALLALALIVFRLVARRRAPLRRPAWDGGLRHLRPSMTYTATGFSNPVRVVFDAVLRPATVEDFDRGDRRAFPDRGAPGACPSSSARPAGPGARRGGPAAAGRAAAAHAHRSGQRLRRLRAVDPASGARGGRHRAVSGAMRPGQRAQGVPHEPLDTRPGAT